MTAYICPACRTRYYSAADQTGTACEKCGAAIEPEMPGITGSERCLICGDPIPEGRQVCINCEKGATT